MQKINFEKLEKIARLTFRAMLERANRAESPRFPTLRARPINH